jgi:hypothetical protein
MTIPVRIDYWDILQRSIRIAWENKILWVFGFFASATSGNLMSWVDEGRPFIREFFESRPEVIILAIAGIVFLWLVLFVMSLISTGALVGSVKDLREGQRATFERAWNHGLKAFFGILALALIAVVAFLAVTLVCVVAVVLPLVAGVPGIVISVLIGAILLVPYLAFLFLLAFTITYAERAYVIEGEGILEALQAGWELTRAQFWKSMVVWLMMLLASLVFGLTVVLALLVLAVPFIIIGIANVTAALIFGIPIGLAFLIVVTGAFGTFVYSVWTLAYYDLKALMPPPVPVTPVPSSPAAPPTPAAPSTPPVHPAPAVPPTPSAPPTNPTTPDAAPAAPTGPTESTDE